MIELIKFVVNSFAEKPELIDYDVKENGKDVPLPLRLMKAIWVKLSVVKVKLLKHLEL
jgi:hypothetical protein